MLTLKPIDPNVEESPVTAFIAKNSGLIVQWTTSMKTPMGDIDVVVKLSDYKKVGDLMIPHLMTINAAGTGAECQDRRDAAERGHPGREIRVAGRSQGAAESGGQRTAERQVAERQLATSATTTILDRRHDEVQPRAKNENSPAGNEMFHRRTSEALDRSHADPAGAGRATR